MAAEEGAVEGVEHVFTRDGKVREAAMFLEEFLDRHNGHGKKKIGKLRDKVGPIMNTSPR
jgi:hypothetical protein